MKNNYFILLSVFLLSACDNSSDCPEPTPENYQIETPYYIGQYVDGQIGLSPIKQTTPAFPGQRLDDHGVQLEIVEPVYYQDPFFKVSTDAGYFLWAAERYGDFNEHYFWDTYFIHIGTVALYFQIESIEVTSDKAWDAAHPAGASLGDLIEFSVFSYADYIDNDYQTTDEIGKGNWKRKTLCEMTPADFRLIEPKVAFYFMKDPDVIDQHRLKFRFKLKYAYPPLEQTIKVECIPTKSI